MRLIKTLKNPLLACVSGVGLALAYHPFNQTWLAWLWMAPLLWVLWFSGGEKKRKRRGFALGWTAGYAFFLTNMSWFVETGKTVDSTAAGLGAWLGICAYLAIYPGLFGMFATTVGRWKPDRFGDDRRKPGFDPIDLFGSSFDVIRIASLNGIAWCGLEWVRGWALTGFGWNGLGVALHDILVLIQCVDLIGVTGLSFVLVFCNVVAFATVIRLGREMMVRSRMRPHLDFAAAAGLVITLFLYGIGWTMRPVDKENAVPIKTLIVQMNVPIDMKSNSENALKLINEFYQFTEAFVANGDFDLVMWSETAIPGRFTYPFVQSFLNDGVLPLGDFHLLTGVEEEELDETIYNSIVLTSGSTENYQSYRKTHLVPFGEYLPLRNSWFPLVRWIGQGIITHDFSAGTSYEPLLLERDGNSIDLIPLLCFEDTMGRHARQFVREGHPQLMVNVTNDGWFWESPQSWQHLTNAKFRCIEMRRPMARAANTGVSGVIDEIGSLQDRYQIQKGQGARIIADPDTGNTFIKGAWSGEIFVPKSGPVTLYARWGDWFSISCLGFAILACGVFWVREGKK